MLYNKKGKASGATVAVLVMMGIFLVGGLGGLFFFLGKAPAEALPTTTLTQVSQAASSGAASTLKVKTNDQMSPTNAQQAISGYIVTLKSDGTFDATTTNTLSATADTNFANTVGTKVKGSAFSSAYYGELVEFDVSKEIQPVALKSWAIITTQPKLLYSDTDSTNFETDETGNLTIGSSGKDSLTLRFKNNVTDTRYALKGLIFDTTNTTSEIDKIELSISTGSGVDVSGVTSQRCTTVFNPRRTSSDFCFEFSKPLVIEDNQYVDFTVTFTATATNPMETWNVYAIDEACYQAVRNTGGHSKDDIICNSIQNDAESPADIGGPILNSTADNNIAIA